VLFGLAVVHCAGQSSFEERRNEVDTWQFFVWRVRRMDHRDRNVGDLQLLGSYRERRVTIGVEDRSVSNGALHELEQFEFAVRGFDGCESNSSEPLRVLTFDRDEFGFVVISAL
jgi:hypothetical protein